MFLSRAHCKSVYSLLQNAFNVVEIKSNENETKMKSNEVSGIQMILTQ